MIAAEPSPSKRRNQEAVDEVIRFVDERIVELEQGMDENSMFAPDGGFAPAMLERMREARTRASEAKVYAMFAPSEIGGGNRPPSTYYDVWEALHHRYGPARTIPYQSVAHWTNGPSFLMAAARPEMKAHVEEIVSGRRTSCFGMSEPDAGSDPWRMSTRATRDNGGWHISGRKQWISNGPYADYASLFAVTNPPEAAERRGGISCFLVPTNSRGFVKEKVIRLYGRPGGNESILALDAVPVDETQMLGEEGTGMTLALRGVSLGRLYNVARSVGLARWALELAVDYAQQRETFGTPISDYQGVSFQLAECGMEIYAAQSMGRDLSARLDKGEPAHKEVAIAKAYATEMCFRVYDRCMQVLGGRGLTTEARLYDGWHEARTIRIADGSSEIMRRTIAARLMKGDLSF